MFVVAALKGSAGIRRISSGPVLSDIPLSLMSQTCDMAHKQRLKSKIQHRR